MKKTAFRVVSVALLLTMIVTVFSSCDITTLFTGTNEIPKTAILKTNLSDPYYTFTYGELRNDVIPLDKLADLFESYDEKNKDSKITLSYDEIISRFNADVMKDKGKTLEKIWSLCSKEELDSTNANQKQVMDYFNTLVNALKTQRPITEYKESFWTDDSDDTLVFSKDNKVIENSTDEYKSLRAAAVVFKNYVLDGVEFTEGETEKGQDIDNILYLLGSKNVSGLTENDIVSAVSSVKPELTTIDDIDFITGYTRTIVITLKENETSVLKAFSMHDKKPILDELKKANGYMTVDDYSTSFNTCTITVYVDATTDEITNIIYDKNVAVTSSFTGVNDYASLGTVGIKFNCTDRMDYHFGWHTSDKAVDATVGFYKYNYNKNFTKAVASSDFYKQAKADDKDVIASYFSGYDFDSSIVSDSDYIYASDDKAVVYFYDTECNAMYYIHK